MVGRQDDAQSRYLLRERLLRDVQPRTEDLIMDDALLLLRGILEPILLLGICAFACLIWVVLEETL